MNSVEVAAYGLAIGGFILGWCCCGLMNGFLGDRKADKELQKSTERLIKANKPKSQSDQAGGKGGAA